MQLSMAVGADDLAFGDFGHHSGDAPAISNRISDVDFFVIILVVEIETCWVIFTARARFPPFEVRNSLPDLPPAFDLDVKLALLRCWGASGVILSVVLPPPLSIFLKPH
ncbi:hypothetical protein [Bradyrhizobium cenepequi]